MFDIKEIWEKEGYGKDNPWDNSIAYIYKVADNAEIERDITDAIITKFFIEIVSEGKKYSLTECSCGCGSNKSGTDAVHTLVKRVLETHLQLKAEKTKVLSENINRMLLAHMQKQNEEYTKKALTPNKLVDFEKSWVLRGLKWFTGSKTL